MGEFAYLKKQVGRLPQFSVGIIEGESTTIFGNIYEIQFVPDNTKISLIKDEVVLFNPLETGDAFSHKVCNVCHRFLPTSNFARNQNGKGDRIIRRPSCEDCRKEMEGKAISHKEKKEWELKKPSFIIWECPICHKRTIPDLTSKVVLDHNHKTGEVRGWICDSRNTGIGRFKDEVALLKSAIKFVETN
ncbi:MAG: endonuclease VII domain-containing protein [Helicobacteraceae bacterium]|jgi:hypothetical protein|nr:endonuclease VII domain-containing protein [Helicobacteraceae bacterium]